MDEERDFPGLTAEELDRENAQALPQREQMSLVAPGSVAGTPAAAVLPIAALEPHGDPNEVQPYNTA